MRNGHGLTHVRHCGMTGVMLAICARRIATWCIELSLAFHKSLGPDIISTNVGNAFGFIFMSIFPPSLPASVFFLYSDE